MKHLKYLLIYLIVILAPTAFCAEFNLNSYISATYSGTRSKYECYETYQYGSISHCVFGTRYNGRMGSLKIFIHYPFEEDTNYRLTFNMATDDFRNNFGSAWTWDCDNNTDITNMNSTVWTPTFISYKKAQLSFSLNDNTTCVGVLIRSANYSSDAFTGVNNWNLSNITIYDPDWQSGGSGQGTATPSPSTPDPNQQIIDNANQNTQDVIENNNSNTQQIIDNQNELLTNCSYKSNLFNGTFERGSFNASTGELITSTTRVRNTNFIDVSEGKYIFSLDNFNDYRIVLYVYDNSNNFISSESVVSWSTFPFEKEFSANRKIKFAIKYADDSSITASDITNFSIKKYECSNRLDDTTNAINDTNNFLKDDSDPSISDNDFLTTFNSIGLNDPLSYLLTLPTQLINKIVSLSSSCTSINLGTLYGVMLTMPCINLETILGSTVWNIIDVIFSVSLLVVILKNLYDTFSNLLTMGAEKEAKEKFSMPTPMDFLAIILGGDR